MFARCSASTPPASGWPTAAKSQGVGYIGRRPTVVDGVDERLEVHLFDFDEDLYGQTLEVELTDLIRGDRKFDSLDAMIHQMELDAARARELLMPAF